MTRLQIKERLIALVVEQLQAQLSGLEEGRQRAKADAKEHVNEYGSMYDNAKETANALQAGFLRQMQMIEEVLLTMRGLPVKICDTVETGCVIVAGGDAYFVSTGLIEKPLEVSGVKYTCVNITAPIIHRLRNVRGSKVTVF
jgi:hypothetical protein